MNLQVYYGADLLVDAPHGLTNAANVFANGVYPHYEFQNASNTTTAVVQMNKFRSQPLATFTVPSE